MIYVEKWVSQNGKEQLISNMNEKHIENCINMLKREPLVIRSASIGGDIDEYFYDEEEDLESTAAYIYRFELELLKRRLKAIEEKMGA